MSDGSQSEERAERVADLYAEFRLRLDDGEELSLDDFVGEHPVFEEDLREVDRNERRLSQMSGVFGIGSSVDALASDPAGSDGSNASDPGLPPTPPIAEPTPAPSPGQSSVQPGGKKRTAPRRTRELIDHIVSRRNPFTRYSVERKVGQGSMGEVFRVWDHDLRRTLAMKILSRGFGPARTEQHERTLTRFVAEAQVTSQLDHPSIVPVHDFGVSPDGQAYFTMKLVKGRELLSVIDEHHDARRTGEETDWSLHRLVATIHRICEAMSYAHHKGVLHRDLKPTNIMVGRYGAVYVMDWGLARILGSDHQDVLLAGGDITFRVTSDRDGILREAKESKDKTRRGASVGTPAYMSPEQASGRAEAIDERADVYGVGAILYHVVAGHAPYTEPGKRAAVEAVLFRLQQGPPAAIDAVAPHAPAELRSIIRTAMARAPESRFQSMEQLAQELAAYLEGRTAGEGGPGSGAKGRRVRVAAAVAGVAAVAGAVGYLLGS
ncbi:MAG: serine/threonine-protein kinase [Planctomycetota bacterium]